MTNVHRKPIVVEIISNNENEFVEKVEELKSNGYKECGSPVKTPDFYKQSFIEKIVTDLSYTTDYLFEANVTGAFDNKIVNKLFDNLEEV